MYVRVCMWMCAYLCTIACVRLCACVYVCGCVRVCVFFLCFFFLCMIHHIVVLLSSGMSCYAACTYQHNADISNACNTL